MSTIMKMKSFKLPEGTEPEKIDQLMKEINLTVKGGNTSVEGIITVLTTVLGMSRDEAIECMASMTDPDENSSYVQIQDDGHTAVSHFHGREVHACVSEILKISCFYPPDDQGVTRFPVQVCAGSACVEATFTNAMEETDAGFDGTWVIEPSSFVLPACTEVTVKHKGALLLTYPHEQEGRVCLDFGDEPLLEIKDVEDVPMPVVTISHPEFSEVQ